MLRYGILTPKDRDLIGRQEVEFIVLFQVASYGTIGVKISFHLEKEIAMLEKANGERKDCLEIVERLGVKVGERILLIHDGSEIKIKDPEMVKKKSEEKKSTYPAVWQV